MSLELIRKRADDIVRAKRQVAEGQLTIWNARLDAALDAGDGRAILDVLASRVADDINNCGCNVQCGARSLGEIGIAR
jgi:hypothetical protein